VLPSHTQRCSRINEPIHAHAETRRRSLRQHPARKHRYAGLLLYIHSSRFLVLNSKFLLDLDGIHEELAGRQPRLQKLVGKVLNVRAQVLKLLSSAYQLVYTCRLTDGINLIEVVCKFLSLAAMLRVFIAIVRIRVKLAAFCISWLQNIKLNQKKSATFCFSRHLGSRSASGYCSGPSALCPSEPPLQTCDSLRVA
jgi:hypothetical protein